MLIKRKLLPTGGVFFNISPASGRPGAVSQKHLQYKHPSSEGVPVIYRITATAYVDSLLAPSA